MAKKKQYTARDDRNPRVALSVPQFGQPAFAKRCGRCHDWYPQKAFNGPITGKTQHCLNCRQPVM